MQNLDITDEMIDAACAAVPDLYRVDAMRALEAAISLAVEKNEPLAHVDGETPVYATAQAGAGNDCR